MNHDSKKLSRRDWFRLRVPHRNQTLGEPAVSVAPTEIPELASTGLQPIVHPPNHDGLDLAELPPMREATLTKEQVSALFSDIEKLGKDILLMQRSSAAERADATRADSAGKLQIAHDALLTGAIQRVQIRYRWENSLWIDTLKSEPDGFHIVRIAHVSK